MIEADCGQLDALELAPGLPAEVYTTTGERTALDYLLSPCCDSLRRAWRET